MTKYINNLYAIYVCFSLYFLIKKTLKRRSYDNIHSEKDNASLPLVDDIYALSSSSSSSSSIIEEKSEGDRIGKVK